MLSTDLGLLEEGAMTAGAADEVLRRAVDDRSLPGLVALVGDRDGVLYERAFGLINVDSEEPVREDTMFAIMSMAKAFTSVSALQLIENGELELEQPVAAILPAFG